MIFNIYAIDDIETIPLHKYISVAWGSENDIRGNVLAFDTLPNTVTGAGTIKYRSVLTYQSALNKNTFYHIRYKLRAENQTSKSWLEEKTTGVITDQGGQLSTVLLPANALSPYIQAIQESYETKTYKAIEMSYDRMHAYNMTSYVGAKVYYYFTKEANNEFTVDAVMYFNDEFFQYGWSFEASSTRYMQCYLGILIPMEGSIKILESDVYPVGGIDYNGKLDQIISLLQAQGGGLSKEDIQAATLAALEQHDAAEEQKANNKIQQIKQQIESLTEPYKENLTTLQDSMRSITSALNYSGTSAVLTLPEARNPMTNNSLLWEQKQIDLAAYWDMLPAALRSAISIVLSFVILYKVIMEMVDEITWVIYMDKNVDKAERGGVTI